MTSNQRREKLIQMLEQSQHPITATSIAKEFDVSRQIIVGDIALMRASGAPILATHFGYIYQKPIVKPYFQKTIASCHQGGDQMKDELYIIVDNGCAVLDVTVEHPVYGQISGQLQIYSRADADQFLQKVRETAAEPLSLLTGGLHLHTIECRDETSYQKLLSELSERGILYEK